MKKNFIKILGLSTLLLGTSLTTTNGQGFPLGSGYTPKIKESKEKINSGTTTQKRKGWKYGNHAESLGGKNFKESMSLTKKEAKETGNSLARAATLDYNGINGSTTLNDLKTPYTYALQIGKGILGTGKGVFLLPVDLITLGSLRKKEGENIGIDYALRDISDVAHSINDGIINGTGNLVSAGYFDNVKINLEDALLNHGAETATIGTGGLLASPFEHNSSLRKTILVPLRFGKNVGTGSAIHNYSKSNTQVTKEEKGFMGYVENLTVLGGTAFGTYNAVSSKQASNPFPQNTLTGTGGSGPGLQ